MKKKPVSKPVRIRKDTLQVLRFIKAYTEETYDEIIKRLGVADLTRLRKDDEE